MFVAMKRQSLIWRSQITGRCTLVKSVLLSSLLHASKLTDIIQYILFTHGYNTNKLVHRSKAKRQFYPKNQSEPISQFLFRKLCRIKLKNIIIYELKIQLFSINKRSAGFDFVTLVSFLTCTYI